MGLGTVSKRACAAPSAASDAITGEGRVPHCTSYGHSVVAQEHKLQLPGLIPGQMHERCLQSSFKNSWLVRMCVACLV